MKSMKIQSQKNRVQGYFFSISCMFLLFSCRAFAALEPREEPLKMTTSVIIPCHYTHFPLIPNLLTSYENQSVLPDEIVISLSGCENISHDLVQEVTDQKWSFKLMITESPEILSAGQNRNIACMHSSGDLLICQDADDLPYPQRVEVIKHIFERFKLDHLMHFYYYITRIDAFESIDFRIDLDQLDFFLSYGNNYFETIEQGGGTYGQVAIHNGNIAITRTLFDQIKWPEEFSRSEDTDFNINVYEKVQYKALLTLPLISYRQFLSTDEAAVNASERLINDWFLITEEVVLEDDDFTLL